MKLTFWLKAQTIILLVLLSACSFGERAQTTAPSSTTSALEKSTPARVPSQSPSPGPQSDPFQKASDKAMSAATITQSAPSQEDWELVASLWQEAIELMKAVPTSSPQWKLAQKKIQEYQRNQDYAKNRAARRLDSPQLSTSQPPDPFFQKGIDEAMNAAFFAQSAEYSDNWEFVASLWQQAIDFMKSVPASSPNHAQAQKKLTEYQRNLNIARQKAASSPTQSPSPILPAEIEPAATAEINPPAAPPPPVSRPPAPPIPTPPGPKTPF